MGTVFKVLWQCIKVHSTQFHIRWCKTEARACIGQRFYEFMTLGLDELVYLYKIVY